VGVEVDTTEAAVGISHFLRPFVPKEHRRELIATNGAIEELGGFIKLLPPKITPDFTPGGRTATSVFLAEL